MNSLSDAMHAQYAALKQVDHPQARALADHFLDLEMRARDQEDELENLQSDRMYRELAPMREFVEELWKQYVQDSSNVKERPIQYEVLAAWVDDLREAADFANQAMPKVPK